MPAIRDKVTQWRDGDQPTPAPSFVSDRSSAGERPEVRVSLLQCYAVETLVYLYEVATVRSQKQLIETFAHRQDLKLLQYDQFARYYVKMATGSGKTKRTWRRASSGWT